MTDVTDRPYVLISCDAHAGADLLDYKPYLEKQFHDEFDARADSYQEDAWGKFRHGNDGHRRPEFTHWCLIVRVDLQLGQPQATRAYGRDWIAAEMIFPNTVPPFYPRGIINAAGPATAGGIPTAPGRYKGP